MKKRTLLQIILMVLVTASCMQPFSFQKRKYRPGFYRHSASEMKLPEARTRQTNTPFAIHEPKAYTLYKKVDGLKPAETNHLPQKILRTDLKRIKMSLAKELKRAETISRKKEVADPDKEPGAQKKERTHDLFKKFSWLFFLLALSFTIVLFTPFAGIVGIDFLVVGAFLSFLLAIIFFVLKLFAKRKLKKLSQQPQYNDSREIEKDKIRLYKRLYWLFLVLDVLFLLSCFIFPPMIVLVFIGLPFTFFYGNKWRKCALSARNRTLTPEQKQKDAENEKQNRKVTKYLRKALLFFLIGLMGVALISLLLFTGFSAQTGVFILFLGVVFYSIFSVYSSVYAICARVYARRILNENKKEKLYPAKRKAHFAAIFGLVFPMILTIITAVFIAVLGFSGGD
jgi:Flp pilus assembly protein TadB